MKKRLFLFLLLFPLVATPQDRVFNDESFEFDLGGDIFTDFEEEVEATRVMRDERYYRYSRFFSVDLTLGFTTFDGNRGSAMQDQNPSFGLGVNYFMESNFTMGLGIAFSGHSMLIEQPTRGYPFPTGVGLIESDMMRFWFSVRYYIDTTNLGTAITFSNPYLILRGEYWYETLKFKDQPNIENRTGGGMGFSGGFGLEFPIEFKEYYFGVEFLVHSMNLPEKYTQALQPVYEDLSGYAYTLMFSLNQSW